MPINLSNFLLSKKEKAKMADFQDLDHIDGVSVSTTSANLYSNDRDDLVLFYFRHGAEHASVYTQSQVVSENIKWNFTKFLINSDGDPVARYASTTTPETISKDIEKLIND